MNLKKIVTLQSLFFLPLFVSCTSSQSTQLDSNLVAEYLFKGNDYAQVGKYQEALDLYNKALRLDPNSASAERNSAIVYVRMGNYKQAVELFKHIENFYQDDSEFLYYYGEALRGSKLYKDSIAIYRKANFLTPDDSRIIKSLAWVYIKENEPILADKIISPYFKTRKYDLQAMLIVSTLQVKRKKYYEAIKTLKNFEMSRFSVVGKDKELVDTERVLLLETLASAYLGAREVQKAQKLYGLVLVARPFLASSLLGSARCDVTLKKPAEAIKKLEKALASDPNNPDVVFLLADLYKGEAPQKALFYYKRMLDLADTDPNYKSQVAISKEEISKSILR